MTMVYFPVQCQIFCCISSLLLGLKYPDCHNDPINNTATSPTASLHNIYAKDDRLKAANHYTYEYDKESDPVGSYLYDQYMWVIQSYTEEEIARTSHKYFDEQNRLLYSLGYSLDILSDSSSFCEENIYERNFARGYQADYDGKRLMSELQYYGSNEYGIWEHRIYQYDKQGNCILKVDTTEDEIMLHCYEYHEDTNKIDEYTYLVTDDWELYCDDGSIYYLYPAWKKPAIKKVAIDNTVEKELYYGKTADMGQQDYLMPKDIETTVNDHKYVVNTGDCLWDIAYKCYGQGTYYDLIYLMNRHIIGWDKNHLLPGTRLYIPEIGNARNTKP